MAGEHAFESAEVIAQRLFSAGVIGVARFLCLQREGRREKVAAFRRKPITQPVRQFNTSEANQECGGEE